MRIPIARPEIGKEEINRVVEVLKSGMLAQGRLVEEFEKAFAEYVGVKEAVAVSNGTVALDLALKALGIKEGDEVIVPAFTFIATANAVLFQHAKPVFADIDEKTMNIDANDAAEKITSKTKAIIGVHLYGHPFDVKAISDLCEDHKLMLIEDAAQAHGAEFEGIKVGSFGIGCFSFYPTKNMTTAEGGMITTNDSEIVGKLRLLRNHGDAGKYNHIMLGYNYRMTDVNAALGIEQLKKLDEFNERRIRNAEYLNKNLRNDIVKPIVVGKVKHVFHQYVVRVENRQKFIEQLEKAGIGYGIHYPLAIYEQPLYRNLGLNGDCRIAEKVSRQVVSLPVYPSLSKEDLEYVVEVVNGMEL
ncbi:MAG: DegT/DnrJ/EryC1/StrS family aminotransferase [Archaeoglobus sp.]|nr:DegT/DnrJ/EryC1/StrS family aminotransferase [Archaeoglobus sp.]